MATATNKPTPLSGYFKRGSSWRISFTRKDETGTAIDITGLVTRAMFRAVGVDGEVVVMLDEAHGIEIAEPTAGSMVLKITREQSARFAPGVKVYFDVEQTSPVDPDYEWQSPTYVFKVVQQVTR